MPLGIADLGELPQRLDGRFPRLLRELERKSTGHFWWQVRLARARS